MATTVADWCRDEESDRRLVDGLVKRLADQAVRCHMQLEFVKDTESILGTTNMPRLDVSAGGNTLTLWPDDEEIVWVRAAVTPVSDQGRVDTIETDVFVDDSTIRLLVALLKGEGHVVRRWLRRDVFDVRQGKAWLRLPVQCPPTVLERIWSWPSRYDMQSFNAPMSSQGTRGDHPAGS